MKKSIKKISILVSLIMLSELTMIQKNVTAKSSALYAENSIANDFKTTAIPYQVKITKSTDNNIAKAASTLPSKFDLRTQGKVTPVKYQGQIGDCWAFATVGSMESYLKINENKIYDFSEINMAMHHGFDKGPNDGGNSQMATAYLARWEGPVSEADDPYPNPPDAANIIKRDNLNIRKHIQGVDFIPDRTSPADNDDIKNELMKNGAVATCIYMDNKYLNSENASYYCNDVININHVIDIVGWDDTYSKDNFLVKPAGDGAFICKNSYSEYFGDGGYFYISYYDKEIGTYNAVFTDVEPVNNYSNSYQYDTLGMTGYISYGSTNWFSNVFTAENNSTSSEALKAVSFYTIKKNAYYEIYAETDYNKNGLNKIASNKLASGTIEEPGYHTIKLPSSINLLKGEKFAVAVKLVGSEIAYEGPINGYSSKAVAENGQSYISNAGTYWLDVNTKYPNLNVCLKAFTTKTYDVPVSGVTANNTVLSINKDCISSIAAVVYPASATDKKLIWESDKENIATVDDSGNVKGISSGKAIITVTTEDGNFITHVPVYVKGSIDDKTSDINNDGFIDIMDIAAEAKLYNIKSSDSLYNGSFDLNTDNIIDIFDLILISNKFVIN